jgi:diaminopimelate epimerase
VRVSKYHGTGNDFVMIEDLDDLVTLTPALVAGLCDRHRGIGGDGVIRIAPSDRADFFMDYWNQNGEVAEMCGNGIRCLAKLVYERGRTDRDEIDVDTRSGVKQLRLTVEGGEVTGVTVDMGPPAFRRGEIPMTGEPGEEFAEVPFEVEGVEYRATAVSMGNPHLVLIGESDPAEVDIPRLGPQLEHHEDFPQRTNVEFVRIEDGAVRLRVWERGSGETMACGTGACAALAAASRAGLVPRRAPVIYPGGELEVEWAADDRLFLTGPATFVFDTDIDAGAAEALGERLLGQPAVTPGR